MREKIKHVSLFSGIGAFEKPIKEVLEKSGKDYELVAFSEIDKWAVTSYCAIHEVDEKKNMGDISKISPNEVPDCDLITHGSPCFRAGTLITTDKGLKEIEDIEKGDLVLTHKNRFRKVVKPMITKANKIYELKVQGSPVTYVTNEHPYYVREMHRVWDSDNQVYKRVLDEPKWKTVEKLNKSDFIGFPINNLSENPYNITKEEAWLIGRYVADGYLRDSKRKDRPSNFKYIIFCVGKDKIEDFRDCKEYNASFSEDETVYKVRIWSDRLQKLCIPCGKGAENKEIPSFILNLPNNILEEFLEGYLSGDGCIIKNKHSATTISSKLAFGLSQVVAKLYKAHSNISYNKVNQKKIIEGRTVNQNPTWIIRFSKDKLEQQHPIIEDNYIWLPFRSKILLSTDEYVYNFEVEEDNSYVANNLIVHNCQDFSVAGKGEGGNLEDGTRSSLMWYTVNIVKHKKPKYVIWENVKGVLSKKHKHNFDNYLEELELLGYNNYYQVLNAKNYGIPQNRERIFVVSIRKDIDKKNFKFPEPFDNGIRLRHLLEDSVDEKYYINNEKCEKLLEELNEKKLLNGEKFGADSTINDPQKREVSNCITGRYNAGIQNKKQIGMVVAEPKINIVGDIEEWRQRGSVYSEEGIMGCLSATDYKTPKLICKKEHSPNKIALTISDRNNREEKEPYKTLEEPEIRACISPDKLEVRQNGRRFKENDEPMFTLTAQDRHGIIKKENSNNLEVVENNPNMLLNIGMLDMKGSDQVRRVYDPGGLCPTLDTMSGGHREPKIVEKNELKFVGGITDKDWVGDGKVLSRNLPQGERVYDEDGIACSQTANGGGTGSYTGLYLERPKVVIDSSIAPSVAKNFEREKEKIGETTKDIYRCNCTTGWQDHQIGINISPTLRASNNHTSARDNNYRVRKLTPLECWRLMGFSDEDYYKAKKALMNTYYNGKDKTNSQMYKQAGNSIVVNVLKEIYEKLFNN